MPRWIEPLEFERGLKEDGLDPWTHEEHLDQRWRGVCFKKGGGGAPPQQPQSTQVTQTSLPDYVEPYFTDLIERAEEESLKEFQPVPTQRIADFNPTELESFQTTRDTVGSWKPALGEAASTATLGQSYMPTSIRDISTQGQIDAAQQYLNPYTTNVLDVAANRAQTRFDEQQAGRNTAAMQAGAFGSSRAMLGDMQAQRDLNETLALQEANVLQQAQDQAFKLAQKEAETGIQRDLRAGALGGDFANLGLRAAGAGQELGLADANALQQVGAIERDLEQQRLDLQTADFMSERDYNRNQLGWYGALLHGVPVTPNSQTQTFQARNPTAELLGLGIGAAGLAKYLGR